MDLYADGWTTFRKVTFPIIFPGILAAALLAFALSIDDYVITLFNGANADVPALGGRRQPTRDPARGQRPGHPHPAPRVRVHRGPDLVRATRWAEGDRPADHGRPLVGRHSGASHGAAAIRASRSSPPRYPFS